MTLEEMRKGFEAAKTLGAAAVVVRVPQALALLECVETLKSIACADRPSQDAKTYWMTRGYEQTAEVAANDTLAARDALAKLKEAGVTI